MRIYKIRNKLTGQFSTGSSWPSWSNRGGKTWTLLSYVRQHLMMYLSYHKYSSVRSDEYAKMLEIVEYDVVERRVVPLEEVLHGGES